MMRGANGAQADTSAPRTRAAAPSGKALVRLSGVSKRFESEGGQVTALEGVDLEIRLGEVLCIVGPSGSGKSTLLSLVAGLSEPTEGTVLIEGSPLKGPGPDRGVVFQEAALFPWLNVAENVAFGLKIRGTPRAARDELVRHWLGVVGLADFARSFVHELSGGMKQKVALARSLALDPKIILMDEPFAALDVRSRRSLQDEMQRIFAETSKTVLFVTHSLSEAVTLGDRIVLMSPRPGRVKKMYYVDLVRPRSSGGREALEITSRILADFGTHAGDEDLS